MNWLDLGLIVFIIIFLIIGIKRGLMTSVLSNFSFGINVIISFFMCKPIGWILNKVFGLQGAITRSYLAKFTEVAEMNVNLITVAESDLSATVTLGLNHANISGIPKLMFNLFVNNSSLYGKLQSSGLGSRTLAEIVANSYSSFFVSVISFVITIGLVYLIVFLFSKLADLLRRNGLIKFVDNTLGAVYGLFRVFLILVVVCIVLKLLSPLSFMTGVTNYISDSFFGKLIYNQVNNFIDNYLNYQDLINLFRK